MTAAVAGGAAASARERERNRLDASDIALIEKTAAG